MEHYAKICTISTVVRWASAAVVCAAVAVLVSWFAPSPARASLCVTATLRKQVEAGMKGREGGGLLYRDRPSLSPHIMDESIDAVLCTFSADPAGRRGKNIRPVAYGMAARV